MANPMRKFFTQFFPKSFNSLGVKLANPITLSSIGIAAIGGLTLTLGVTANSSPSISSSSTPTLVAQTAKVTVVRIGHQKFDPLTLVKNKGDLEKKLKPFGVTEVKWTEFPSGPPMLEALNAGSLDIARTGDAPPIIAQAAGTPFVYVGSSAPKNKSSALLVKKNSPITKIADLKGKKVAFAKGSSANYLIVRILESGGLKWDDITPVYLAPADARAAFEKDSVDAWVIWDPFYAAVQASGNVRVLRDSQGLVANRDFYLANKKFADDNPQIIQAIREETQKVSAWADKNPDQVADFLSPLLKIDQPVLLTVTQRRDFGFEKVTPKIIAEQQAIADSFYNLKLIPKPIKVADVVWQGAKK
jgi:sulfonate transport system substrate-binding protein